MGLFPSNRKIVRNAAAQAVEALESRLMMSSNWFVSNDGHNGAAGHRRTPVATIQYAINHAEAGDTIIVRGGNYSGGITVDKPNLTIVGAAGEDVRISSPNDNESIQSAIRITEDASHTTLQNLDISGGYYYALKTESTWDTGVSDPHGASNLTIRNCRLHDSGRDVIKFTPGTNHSRILSSEIYNSGRRDGSNAEGIDAVQANYALVRNSYIHDTTTNGIYYKGGSIGTIIERNRVSNVAYSGILLGQSSDENWFDTSANPGYYESIGGIVRNNIVTNCEGAGIGAWSALNAQIYNNTLSNVANSMFSGLLIQGQEHWPSTGPQAGQDVVIPSTNVAMFNNIVVVNSDRPVLEIREGGLTGSLSLSNNIYRSTNGRPVFSDLDLGFRGSMGAWRALGRDAGSRVADPKFRDGNNFTIRGNSPAANRGIAAAGLVRDFNGDARTGAVDIGAQSV
jgi:Right handed beta helix region